MPIELDRDTREEAIQSIQRYFTDHLEERIGNIQAGALLSFFIEEIGPVVYNLAVRDVQERLNPRMLAGNYRRLPTFDQYVNGASWHS